MYFLTYLNVSAAVKSFVSAFLAKLVGDAGEVNVN